MENSGLFDRLQRNPVGFAVVRAEATRDKLQKYDHVTMVPMYDIVYPDVNSKSVYGEGTRLVSIRNDEKDRLWEILPGTF